MGGIVTEVSQLIGGTPVVGLGRIAPDCDAEIFGKLESFNPGGSVKDRIGLAMIEAAEHEGLIEPGKTTIVEATSGNTGIALAFVCAAKGYELVLTLPQGMSREREALLALYGARVEIIESMGGMDEAVTAAERIASASNAWMPRQFSNPANPAAHEKTTGPEIWDALEGNIDALVCGVGTGGTITGTGRFLKSKNKNIKVVAVEPLSSAVLSGDRPGAHRIQGIGAGFVPDVLDVSVVDEILKVTDDEAITTAWAAARSEGLLVGMSCGAALWGAIELAKRDEFAGKRILAVLPDSGERYASAPYFVPSN